MTLISVCWYTCLYVSRGICVLVFVYTYMWRLDRWSILHAPSLNITALHFFFSWHISQTFHSQRFKIQQNHQNHYDWSKCQLQIEFKYFLFVSYVKIYSICQISTVARVCRGFAKRCCNYTLKLLLSSLISILIIWTPPLNLYWGRGWYLIRINRLFHQHRNLNKTIALV